MLKLYEEPDTAHEWQWQALLCVKGSSWIKNTHSLIHFFINNGNDFGSGGGETLLNIFCVPQYGTKAMTNLWYFLFLVCKSYKHNLEFFLTYNFLSVLYACVWALLFIRYIRILEVQNSNIAAKIWLS